MSEKLPPRANLEYLKKQAKDLLKAHKSGSEDAQKRVESCLPRLTEMSGKTVRSVRGTLQEAQHVIAREYGFDKWASLVSVVNESAVADEPDGKETGEDELSGIPATVIDMLKHKYAEELPGDYYTQLILLKKQTGAYRELVQFNDDGVPREIMEDLKTKFAEKMPEDYYTQLILLKKQVNAYKELQTIGRTKPGSVGR